MSHGGARVEAVLRVCAVLVVLALLIPGLAVAGRNSMIPPGQEQRIRELVDAAVADARAAGELPAELGETVDLHIDRDHIRVGFHVQDGGDEGSALPWVLIYHPEAVPDEVGGALAPGVLLRCGPVLAPLDCAAAEAGRWRPLAESIAAARAPLADQIWQVEEEHSPPPVAGGQETRREGVLVDRVTALAAALLGLGLALFGGLRGRGQAWALRWPELLVLGVLLAAFVLAATRATAMLPLHEHNSFVGRSDCAIDPRCTWPPAGAWSMTTLHVYGLVLSGVPLVYSARTLSIVSLACFVLVLVLVWGLARTLCRALGRPALGPVAGLCAVAVLVTHPVAWRLASAASFWPWAIMWALAAAWAGLWAGLSVGDEDRRVRVAGVLAWLVAAVCLAHACGGNYVLLTLGTCLGLAPLCWTPLWSKRAASGPRSWSATLMRALLVGLAGAGLFALITASDYLGGYHSAFNEGGLDDSNLWLEIRAHFSPLLFDGRVSAPVWRVPLIFALAWLWPRREDGGQGRVPAWLRPTLILAPLLYAWLVPTAFLGIAAGEIIGSGYPVGFINHHWELTLTALAAGLGVAWIVGALERHRPLAELLGERGPAWLRTRLRWAWIVPLALCSAAAIWGPRVDEGWRMATGERVLERELVALEAAFAELPEHDVLVIAPRMLAPTTDARSEWDPLEVMFPRGAYAEAMRARGLEPAPIVELDLLAERPPGARVLFYLGSSLRSFQPHEIEAGAVPEDLERPELRELHHQFEFEAVHEFSIATDQHAQISQRLGADRVPELELGFYWLHPRE